MNEEIRNISLIELADIEEMTVRAFNILKYSRLTSLENILFHYNENGDFKKLRNCGGKTNEELISLCLKYKDYIIRQNIDKVIKPKDELKEIIENLNIRQKTILNSVIKSFSNNLSVRAYKALEKLLNKTFTIKYVYNNIFADEKFDFKNVRNVGDNTIVELNKFKSDVFEYIKLVSLFENENDLETEYYNSLLTKYFPKIEIHKLNKFYDKNGEIQIFSLINQLLENEYILANRELIIFKNTFNYFANFKYKQLDEIAPLLNITRERTRQLRNKTFDNLNNYFKFITTFDINFNALYNINLETDFIIITNDIIEKINKNENTNFNKLFITKIFSIICNQTHTLIGREKDLLFNIKKRFVNDWKTTYLIHKKFIEIFFFERFADDIYNRLNERIIDTYSFHFQSYLLKFFKIKDYLLLPDISTICEYLLFEEFEIVLDLDENIIFQKNIHKPVHEYAYEILKEIQEPTSVKTIFQKVVEKYPNYECNQDSLRASMQKENGFICFGRTSTYGLKIWEEKYSDIKGGTIRDIVEEILNKYSEPKHIDEITKYVCKYRDTNAKNIYYNIRIEENKRFIFFKNRYVGLKSKKYSNQFINKKTENKTNRRTWDENFTMLRDFIKNNDCFPDNQGNEEEQKLYRFCSVMKGRYRNNKLNEEQIQKLQSINFQFEQSKRKTRKSWFDNYDNYLIFINENKREPDYKIKNERKLYYWKRNSIQSYNIDNLTDGQIKLLQKINMI